MTNISNFCEPCYRVLSLPLDFLLFRFNNVFDIFVFVMREISVR